VVSTYLIVRLKRNLKTTARAIFYEKIQPYNFGWQMYDTPFRSYDAQLGRFHQIDPLADSQSSFTPYNFANNDPIFWNDPTGLAPDVSDIIRTLLDSKHGGNWSSNDVIRVYRTEEDSFWSGVIYRERFGMWDMNDDRFQDGGTNSRSTAFSIFYQNRAFNGRLFSNSEATLAFKFMVKMSFEETTNKKGKLIRNPIREVAAWLTSGGILIQPWEGPGLLATGKIRVRDQQNSLSQSFNDYLRVDIGKLNVSFRGIIYDIYGQIHTHPSSENDPKWNIVDKNNSGTYGIPFYNINDGYIRNTFGKRFGTVDKPSKILKN
jgi:RHS repeat-associated protein